MKTIINIKADRDVKTKAQRVAKRLGMPLSVVINNYLRDFIRTKEVHFSLGQPEGELKPAVERRLATMRKDVLARKNLSPRFKNAEEAIRYLHS